MRLELVKVLIASSVRFESYGFTVIFCTLMCLDVIILSFLNTASSLKFFAIEYIQKKILENVPIEPKSIILGMCLKVLCEHYVNRKFSYNSLLNFTYRYTLSALVTVNIKSK